MAHNFADIANGTGMALNPIEFCRILGNSDQVDRAVHSFDGVVNGKNIFIKGHLGF